MYADVSIKARYHDLATAEAILLEQQATYLGLDVQQDTYYKVEDGILKLRVGNLEHVLIHYSCQGLEGARKTEVQLYLKHPAPDAVQKLYGPLPVLGQVRKQCKIFFIHNVKFHLVRVEGLGTFVEVAAIDLEGTLGLMQLQEQCVNYKELLEIEDEDLVHTSYIDL